MRFKRLIQVGMFGYRLLFEYQKLALIVSVLYKVLLGILPFFTIWVSQKLVNSVANFKESRDLNQLIILFIAEVLVLLLIFVFQQLSQIQDQKMKYLLGRELKEKISRKVMALKYIEFENPEFYNRFQRLDSAQSQLFQLIHNGLSLITSLITVVSVLFILLSINVFLLPILIIGVTPLFIIQIKFGRKKYFLTKELTVFNRKQSYTMNLLQRRETLKEIKIFGLVSFLMGRWRSYYQKNAQENLKILKRQSLWMFISRLFLLMSYACSGVLVLTLIVSGGLLVGSFVAVLQAVDRIQSALNSTSQSLSSIYETIYLIDELKSFLDTKERDEGGDNVQLIHSVKTIEINDLMFTYPDAKKPSLSNINLKLEKGKKIAIVGENGSGKTTLIKCLTGLYETSNSIKVNGFSLENIKLSSFHNCIAVLFQDFNRYFYSVKENIGFGRIENVNNLAKIRDAAFNTGIDKEISSLENGYDSFLGRLFEKGTDFSGGQWQKLALSRSIFRKSDVIILDEPTASLDPESEVEIIEDLFGLLDNQLVIFITHRLGAARFADEVYVLEDGMIKERGHHEQLIKMKGVYHRMFQVQSKWYNDDLMEVK